MREFAIKGVLINIISVVTFYLFGMVDNLWAAFDKDSQTLHDKIIGTLVVQGNAVEAYE